MKLFRSLSALAFVLVLAGCGSDGGPTAVDAVLDTTPPSTPVGLHSSLAVTSEVVLAWTPNSEADVAGYEVYLYSPVPGNDNAYVRVADVTRGSSWTIPDVTEATTQYYKVCAVDASGNRSAKTAAAEVHVNPASGASTEPGTDERPIRH